jgi:hypothetical protein
MYSSLKRTEASETRALKPARENSKKTHNQPNVTDIKLGQKLHTNQATQEKKNKNG